MAAILFFVEKQICYNYDLISDKVNRVVYQPTYFDVTAQAWITPPDQYYHLYAYDAENRITDVYTGRDSVMVYLFPEREAHYTYYKHGPLARTDLGQLRVQGLDYAYTLQGWLKAVNPARAGTLANGTDTTEASPVAQDAYGFSLHYYSGDYKAIGYTPAGTSVLGGLGSSAAALYNGNIAAMGVNIPQLGATKVYNYHYDQLNRLVAMDAYNGLNGSAGTFTPVSISDYQERAAYDPNGNIQTYQRNGDAGRGAMDNLSYSYTANTNRLHKVTDAAADASAGTYSQYNDIKQGQLDNNYKYDGIGNLVNDSTASITNISWTVYGKIRSITDSGKVINYTYDATGNRILKATSTDTTVYVRDATGNVLAIYEKKPGCSLAQTQVPVYGSSRLGMVTQHIIPDSLLTLNGGFGNGKKSIFTRGEKLFELSNHLGNVLVTVTDRRQQTSAGGVTVDSYLADIASASDYYPFGMLMPSRNYQAGNYRFGFNGQEKDDEIKGSGNSYTAEFWEYDPRIGRRWNLDPKPIPGVSEYSVFNNSPIWYSDPLGDTLSNPQLVDALKIGYNTVQSHLDKKTFNIGVDYSGEVNKAVLAYEEKNKLNFGDLADFQQQALDYYKGFKEVAGSYGGGSTMSEYGNKILSLANPNNEATVIRTTQTLINSKNGQYGSILQQTMRITPLVLDAGVPVEVGPGFRGPMINSNTQRAIVESKAGFKFTETTINRYLDPARTVDAADLRRVVGTNGYADPQGASGATAHYGTILRNGKSYNLKVVYSAESNTIYHFHYSRAAMGPLPKIPK